MQKNRFPNETDDYRAAREELLAAELELRRRIEEVAAMRRGLPLGGVAEDYRFDAVGDDGQRTEVRLSELFAPGHDSLFVYSFMYGPKMEAACPLCTSFLDGLDGNAEHIAQRMSLAVVAQSPIERVQAFGDGRGWSNLRLLSSADNSYQRDYLGEDADGNQWPMANVFVRRDGAVHHFWGSELLFEVFEGGDRRHMDLFWPLWNVLDATPDGRGEDWYPALSYDA